MESTLNFSQFQDDSNVKNSFSKDAEVRIDGNSFGNRFSRSKNEHLDGNYLDNESNDKLNDENAKNIKTFLHDKTEFLSHDDYIDKDGKDNDNDVDDEDDEDDWGDLKAADENIVEQSEKISGNSPIDRYEKAVSSLLECFDKKIEEIFLEDNKEAKDHLSTYKEIDASSASPDFETLATNMLLKLQTPNGLEPVDWTTSMSRKLLYVFLKIPMSLDHLNDFRSIVPTPQIISQSKNNSKQNISPNTAKSFEAEITSFKIDLLKERSSKFFQESAIHIHELSEDELRSRLQELDALIGEIRSSIEYIDGARHHIEKDCEAYETVIKNVASSLVLKTGRNGKRALTRLQK